MAVTTTRPRPVPAHRREKRRGHRVVDHHRRGGMCRPIERTDTLGAVIGIRTTADAAGGQK
jgi:hypothetical protein